MLPDHWDLKFLRSRETVAVNYEHFIRNAAIGSEYYAWMLDAHALKTIILVTANPHVKVTSDFHSTFPGFYENLIKLITYDEESELACLDAMWMNLDPEATFISKSVPRGGLKQASIYGGPYTRRCIECEMRRSQEEYTPRAEAAWRNLEIIRNSRDDCITMDGSHDIVDQAHKTVKQIPNFKSGVVMQIFIHDSPLIGESW